jgi:hypothetical protein
MQNLQVIQIELIDRKYFFLIGELLLEWITLNSDSRNSNTQALIQQVKSCLHPNRNINSNENDLRKVRK